MVVPLCTADDNDNVHVHVARTSLQHLSLIWYPDSSTIVTLLSASLVLLEGEWITIEAGTSERLEPHSEGHDGGYGVFMQEQMQPNHSGRLGDL